MNTSQSIETTVDKSLTSIRLKEANLLTPKTWIFRDIDSSIENTKNLLKKHSLIFKPLFGSQGENIVKISNINDFNKISNDSSIYYIQEFLETEPSHDYRVLAIKSGSSYKTYTMARYGNSYINNYSRGGKCVSVKFDQDLIDVAVKAAETINIPFCGVDIIKSNDKNYIIEVNSIPAWRGMQSIINENISDQIVNSFLNHNVKETNISIQK
jgi:RimK family alpha-L-glutamate ligase